MIKKSNWILGLLFVGLAAYIAAIEFFGNDSKKGQSLSLEGLREIQVNSIRVENSTGNFTLAASEPITIFSLGLAERRKINWRVAGLKGVSVNRKSVDSLLGGIFSIVSIDSFLPDQQDPEDLGLSPSKVSLVFNSGTSRALKISIGARNEYLDKRYARIGEGGRIFMVSESLFQSALKPKNHYLIGTLFDFDLEEVVSLELELEDRSKIVLEKQNNDWKVNQKEGDEVFIRKLLKDLLALSASGFAEKIETDTKMELVLSVKVTIDTDRGEALHPRVLIGKMKHTKDTWRFYAAKEKVAPLYVLSAESVKKVYPREEVLLKVESAPLLLES